MKRKTMLIVIACAIAFLVSAAFLIAHDGGECGISGGDRAHCGGGGHFGIIILIVCVIILLSWIFYFKPRKKQK